jgi:hypothetical protein
MHILLQQHQQHTQCGFGSQMLQLLRLRRLQLRPCFVCLGPAKPRPAALLSSQMLLLLLKLRGCGCALASATVCPAVSMAKTPPAVAACYQCCMQLLLGPCCFALRQLHRGQASKCTSCCSTISSTCTAIQRLLLPALLLHDLLLSRALCCWQTLLMLMLRWPVAA